MADDDWSDHELKASILAYMAMVDTVSLGHPLLKKNYYRSLSTSFGRTPGAFEYRMRNISTVLAAAGRSWLPGLIPAKNVGADTEAKILRLLNEFYARPPDEARMTAIKSQAQRYEEPAMNWDWWVGNKWQKATPAVKRLRAANSRAYAVKRQTQSEALSPAAAWPFPVDFEEADSGKATPPLGVKMPVAVQQMVAVYIRDNAVRDWVLARAKGTCECCRQPAPFTDAGGSPFLEVHHLRQLAHNGSDTTTNAAALCPNCHRRLHYSVDADARREMIYANVPELKREP